MDNKPITQSLSRSRHSLSFLATNDCLKPSHLRPRFLLLLLLSISLQAHPASTLDKVQSRNVLNCGVHSSSPGFAIKDQGRWQGLEADFCRAVASATLGHFSRVRFVPFGLEKGYTALQSGEIDLLVRQLPVNVALEARAGLLFVGALYHTSHGFLALEESRLYLQTELSTERVCTLVGEASKELVRFTSLAKISLKAVEFSSVEAAVRAFEQNRCDVIAARYNMLYYARQLFGEKSRTRLLAGEYGLAATGPLVRADDTHWYKTVRAILSLLITAEQLGVSRSTAGEDDPNRGREWSKIALTGLHLGLKQDWHSVVIGQVGNYRDIYQTHLGPASRYAMPRGVNALARDGGLLIPSSFD